MAAVIIALIVDTLVTLVLTKKFSDAASDRGRSPGWFALIFLLCWLGCQGIAGGIAASDVASFGQIVPNEALSIYIAVMIGSLVGLLIPFIILAAVPAVQHESYYGKMQSALDELRERRKKKRQRGRDEEEAAEEDDEPEPSRRGKRRGRRDEEDEEEARQPARSGGLVIFLISVAAVLGIGSILGGVIYYLNSSSKDETAETETSEKEEAGGGGGGGGKGDGRGNAPAPVTNFDEALEAMRSPTAEQRLKGAEWVQKTPVDEGRQSEIAKSLASLLDDANPQTVQTAARALVTWATPESMPALTRKLSAMDATTAPSLLQALSRLKDPGSAESVAKCLTDLKLRQQAEDLLIDLGPPAAGAVVNFIFSTDAATRRAALRVWKKYNKTEGDVIADRLQAGVNSTNADERQGMAEFLAEIPCDEARRTEVEQALGKLLKDPSLKTQTAAARALKVWAGPESIPVLAEVLDTNLNDGLHEDMQLEIIRTLGRFSEDSAARAVLPFLGDPKLGTAAREALTTIGRKAAPIVAVYVYHRDAKVQEAARSLLAGYGAGPGVTLAGALDALEQKDERMRVNALDYLAQTAPGDQSRDKVVKALNKLLDSPALATATAESALKVAEKWGTKDSVPTLIKHLSASGANQRRLAMVALVAIKDERAIWPIAKRFYDPIDYPHALAALQLMPELTEKVGMVKVEDSDNATRNDAWALLKLFGTKANYDELKAIADKETNNVVKKTANMALPVIKKR